MEKFVCTWLCVDSFGDESSYSQMSLKGKSSSRKFLDIYWKNICVLFLTTRRFNPEVSLLFFTNSNIPSSVDLVDVAHLFEVLNVKIINTDFEYKTPKDYYGSWRNTFFEFSIISSMVNYAENDNDTFLLLDSDCVVTKNLNPLWDKASSTGFLAYLIDYPKDHVVNGLSRKMLQDIYEELDDVKLCELPKYYGGEFLLSTKRNLKDLCTQFVILWPELLKRNSLGLSKFNTEEHVLSYLFYKNNLQESLANEFIKRLWTQPFIYRNVEQNDINYAIWHLPQEKKYGMLKLFKVFVKDTEYADSLSDEEFLSIIKYYLTVPSIPALIYLSRILPVQIARTVYYAFKY